MPNSNTTTDSVRPGQVTSETPKAMANTPRIAIIHQLRTSGVRFMTANPPASGRSIRDTMP